MGKRVIILGSLILLIGAGATYFFVRSGNHAGSNLKYRCGDVVDSFQGVHIYYNGFVNHVESRNLTPDGYNLGLKYQCVEFVKRYY